MPINIRLKLLLTLIIIFSMNGNAFAIYKHKIVVTEFDDPHNWNQPYSPGKVLADRIEKALILSGNFQVISDKNIAKKMSPDMSKSEMMDKPLNGSPIEPRSDGKLGKVMLRENSDLMNRAMAETINPNVTNSHSVNFNADDTYTKYPKEINIEPAIYNMDQRSINDLLLIQARSDGMMKNQGRMKDMDKMSDDSMMMHSDPFPWPVTLGKIPEKASLFLIRGQVVKFDPGNIGSSMVNSNTTANTENAELEVRLQLVQNKTGRVVEKQTFRAFSNSGNRPFSEEMDLGPAEWQNHESSSMSLALSFLTKEMSSFVEKSLFTKALEGEIISINNENVLINIGRQNGVEVGDKFRVYSVGLHLEDPLTQNDLGDIYEKMGFIQVIESSLGFSKAIILVGKDFSPGNLVQSFKKLNDEKNRVSSGLKSIDSDEKIPWWDFNGIKSVP